LSVHRRRVSSGLWTRLGCSVGDLPKFERPPVVEVAIGVQFRPLFGMRGLALAPLWERWRDNYPEIQEQPTLPPTVEGSPPLVPQLLFNVVPLPSTRQWFLNDVGTQLVQVQSDRLLLNWRAGSGDPPAKYPRYRYIRQTFVDRFGELAQFVAEESLGELEITQAELSYINVIETGPNEFEHIGFLKAWSGTAGNHLGEPEQTRITLTFLIPGVGQPPVRLYAEVSPGQRESGEPVLFFTLTARGNPGGKSLDESLKFLDEVREHLAWSFVELTTESMHEVWGRIR
jgi:uncharacterized protein (TIGR04255 family)